jgi:hypothetical protein
MYQASFLNFPVSFARPWVVMLAILLGDYCDIGNFMKASSRSRDENILKILLVIFRIKYETGIFREGPVR